MVDPSEPECDPGIDLEESRVPPGRWRLAEAHPKSDQDMFMRLATKGLSVQ